MHKEANITKAEHESMKALIVPNNPLDVTNNLFLLALKQIPTGRNTLLEKEKSPGSPLCRKKVAVY